MAGQTDVSLGLTASRRVVRVLNESGSVADHCSECWLDAVSLHVDLGESHPAAVHPHRRRGRLAVEGDRRKGGFIVRPLVPATSQRARLRLDHSPITLSTSTGRGSRVGLGIDRADWNCAAHARFASEE